MRQAPVKTVTDYLAAGIASILDVYGADDYEHVVKHVLLPGFSEALRSPTGEGILSKMAPEFDEIFKAHPEASKHLVVMAISLGVGFAALEEVR